MAYRKSIGSRKYTNLSGSGTFQAGGAVTVGGTLNVTGAVTLSGPVSGTMGGDGSMLALNSSGVVVIDSPSVGDGASSPALFRTPTGCCFSSSVGTTVSLIPSKGGSIDGKATVPLLSGSTLINIEIDSDLTADIDASGANGLDTGSPEDETGYYVYVIAQADGATPALLISTNANGGDDSSPNHPTMPATYVYSSEALLFLHRDSNSVWKAYTNKGDGWTYCRVIILADGQNTTSAGKNVDGRQMTPAGGTAMILANYENRGDTYAYVNGFFYYNCGGTARLIWRRNMPNFGDVNDYIGQDTSHSRTPYVWNVFKIPIPASYSGYHAKTFFYNWSSADASETFANFYTLAWKTRAYGGAFGDDTRAWPGCGPA
jgi:hypothetical protein